MSAEQRTQTQPARIEILLEILLYMHATALARRRCQATGAARFVQRRTVPGGPSSPARDSLRRSPDALTLGMSAAAQNQSVESEHPTHRSHAAFRGFHA